MLSASLVVLSVNPAAHVCKHVVAAGFPPAGNVPSRCSFWTASLLDLLDLLPSRPRCFLFAVLNICVGTKEGTHGLTGTALAPHGSRVPLLWCGRRRSRAGAAQGSQQPRC